MSASLHTHQVAEAKALLTQGWKQAAVAAQLGLTASKLCRLLQRDANGEELGPRHATGPRDLHELTPQEQAVATLAMLQKESRKLAAMLLMDSEDCTQETYDKLAAILDRATEERTDEVWPMWWQRACCLTAEQRAHFRGPKQFAAFEPARPRGRFWVDAEGNKHAMVPNALWEFDDESENTPRADLDADGRARVNRQTLKAIDYDSSFYLGTRNISRGSDGYRLADQADFLLELVDCWGLPLRCRIERGPWDNSFWFGIALPTRWWMTKECTDYRFGGIDVAAGGPIKVIQAFKSRHKGLMEGSFNFRQAIGAHKTTDIGRYRGEHEAAAKLMTRIQQTKDPERLARLMAHLPSGAAAADISLENLDFFNRLPKRRKNYWGHKKQVPAEVYAEVVKRDLPASDRWRFLPVKQTYTMSNSMLNLKAKDYDLPFVFSAEGFEPTWDYRPYIPAGWRLFACFHPEMPELGCHIFNAMHPAHAQNPRRIALGAPMGVLPCVETPAFSDRPGDFAGRKVTMAHYTQETRLATQAGKSIKVSTTVANGRSQTVRRGSANPLLGLAAQANTNATNAEPSPAPRRAAEAVPTEAVRAASVQRLAELEAAYSDEW